MLKDILPSPILLIILSVVFYVISKTAINVQAPTLALDASQASHSIMDLVFNAV